MKREKDAERRTKEELNNFSGIGKSVYNTKKNEIRVKTAERIVEARINTGAPKGTVTPPTSTTIIFCKLHEKVRRLEKEWMEARGSVRASFGSVEVHSKCGSFLPPRKDAARSAGGGRESTFNNSRAWDGGDRSAPSQTTRPASASASTSSKEGSLGYRIRMHQILGVKPPLALSAADTDAGMGHVFIV